MLERLPEFQLAYNSPRLKGQVRPKKLPPRHNAELSLKFRLCVQGFPLHPAVRPARDVLCSFHKMIPRQARRVGEQAGNSMNLAVLQLTQIHGYIALIPRPVPPLISFMSKFKRKFKDYQKEGQRRLRHKGPAPMFTTHEVWR